MANRTLSSRLRRALAGLALTALLLPLTGAASRPGKINSFNTWTNVGSRVVFRFIPMAKVRALFAH